MNFIALREFPCATIRRMDVDETYRALTAALRAAEERADRTERELAALQARFNQLMEILVGRGGLAKGHRTLFDRVAAQAAQELPRKVRLRVYVDKYQMQGNDIDCAARMHLCHARCCSLSFELTTQDLDEGVVMWEATAPYIIRHERDGYCSHLDRSSGGCTVYQHRPATCRGYDCRGDKRIWLDFEKGIVAPPPNGLTILPAGGG
jgi:Fe-S-cluster containining protein